MPLWARALLAAEPPPPGPHEQGGAAAAGAAAAAAASQSVACFAGPWGSDCFIEQGEVGGSGQHNATMVSANGCGGNASGDGCAPISRTVLAVAMACVGILIMASLLGVALTLLSRRRRRQRSLAAAVLRASRHKDSATQKLRQVAIPVLVLGPDHSTMHVAFDEACAHQQRCAGGGACACAECQAAALAVAPSCTPADAAPAVAASEVEQPAAAGQGQQAERQQRRWWRRAAAAPAPASAAVAAAAPLPPASTAGACVPPVSTPAQAAGGAGNPGASGASSASSSSPDPSTGGQPGNPRSLVRWVRCAESHSVLSVADLPPPEAQHDEPGSPL